MALFEYRRYEVVPGRMPALLARFREATTPIFEKHGIQVVGFWETVVGTTNELHYLLRWEDMAHRERAWGAFAADPEWRQASQASEEDGPLVERIHNQFWRPTPFSPAQ